jgi:nucleoside-diphosphate-sugar epimerase
MPEDASSRAEGAGARRALVTGATGVVGHFLLPRLVRAGWEVHALSRGAAPAALPPGIRWHVHDIGGGLGALEAAGPGAAFHAAPLSLLPPLVPELAARGFARVLAFGSTSRFTKQGASSERSRAAARALAEAEDRLAEACARHALRWTLFRPTLVYGAGRDRNVSSVARFVRRFGFFPVAGGASGLRQPVHADDLALACLLAVDAPETAGRAYDLGGGTTLTYRAMVEAVFAASGRHPRLLRVPLPLLRAALVVASRLPGFGHLAPDMADRMDADQCFDWEPARRDFGYAPRAFEAAAVVDGMP